MVNVLCRIASSKTMSAGAVSKGGQGHSTFKVDEVLATWGSPCLAPCAHLPSKHQTRALPLPPCCALCVCCRALLAKLPAASLHFNSRVVAADLSDPSAAVIELESGDRVCGDLILAADG
jgi:hypothetical protein